MLKVFLLGGLAIVTVLTASFVVYDKTHADNPIPFEGMSIAQQGRTTIFGPVPEGPTPNLSATPIPINVQASTTIYGAAPASTAAPSPAIIPINEQAATTINGVTPPNPTPNPSASPIPINEQAQTTIYGVVSAPIPNPSPTVVPLQVQENE